jgi:large subunit ribosomal protein L6
LSRLGKIPVKVPKGVQVKVVGSSIEIKGAKGTLSRDLPGELKVDVQDDAVHVAPSAQGENGENTKALWGLYRVLIDNMVMGVSSGYRRELEIVGVGYKAEMKGKDLNISVGYSSPVLFKARQGISYATEGVTKIVIEGIDKEMVGQTAAEIRRIRPPEPYKGKGIRYVGEQVRRKAGKTAGK